MTLDRKEMGGASARTPALAVAGSAGTFANLLETGSGRVYKSTDHAVPVSELLQRRIELNIQLLLLDYCSLFDHPASLHYLFTEGRSRINIIRNCCSLYIRYLIHL